MMLSWRSSNIDEMVLSAFTEKGPLLSKEEAHWRVLHVTGFVSVYEAFIGMEPYVDFFRRIFSGQALLVGKPPRTTLMGGFTLAATQVGQFKKFDEMLETSTSHGDHTSVGNVPIQELPRLEVPLSGLWLIMMV